jgi:hypothetical protein
LYISLSIFRFRAKKKNSLLSKSKAGGANIQLTRQLSLTIFNCVQLDILLIKATPLIKSMSNVQVLPKKVAGHKKAVERVKELDFGLALGLAPGQAV